MSDHWHANVYAPKGEGIEMEWPRIRAKALFADHYRCRACGMTRGEAEDLGTTLTVHHIKPRKEGGTSVPNNLIALCVGCHDAIELNIEDFPSRSKIIGCFENQVGRQSRPAPDDPADWRLWVYGGFARPS